METIKRINREALEQAKKALGQTEAELENPHELTMYLFAVLLGVATFFALKYWEPAFVMTQDDAGTMVFNQTRAIILSILVGLLLVVVYMLYWNQ